ncbi:zinc finger, CCHC-type containing protein [Tanacetum coccineum]
MLKPSNYSLWAIRMQIILEANGLWEMIEPLKTTQSNNKKDKTAIAFLYQALPEEQQLQITKHKTAKAIWDALKIRHIGEERVQQARLQTLKSDFEMLHMKEDEIIDTFTTKLTTLVNKAASLGHTMEDETLVRKLLNAVPDRMSIKERRNNLQISTEDDLGATLLMENLLEESQIRMDGNSIQLRLKPISKQKGVGVKAWWKQPEKMINKDTMKIKATKVEITRRKEDDLPGYKNDHKHYKKSDGGFNQKMDQEDLKTYTTAFVIRGENIGSAADDVISHDMNGCSSVMNSVLVINLNTSNGNDGLETGLIYYSLFRLVCFNNNHELTYLAISSKVAKKDVTSRYDQLFN